MIIWWRQTIISLIILFYSFFLCYPWINAFQYPQSHRILRRHYSLDHFSHVHNEISIGRKVEQESGNGLTCPRPNDVMQPPPVTIRVAHFHDLSTILNLRMNVFYPSVR